MNLESRRDQPGESNIKQRQSNREMQENGLISSLPEAQNGTVLLLLKNRRKFLNFVRSSLHELDDAEEILQQAALKVIERASTLRDPSRAEAWIYRLLRNEITDYFRTRAAQSKRSPNLSGDVAATGFVQREVPRLCPCAHKELAMLRANYSEALRAMEMEGEKIASYARRKSMSLNSATVLLHRARKSLRSRLQRRCGTCAGAGCFDCRCPA